MASLLPLVGLLALAATARGHGYIATPAGRNVIHNTDYCPHCLNAGGTAKQSGYGSLRFPANDHGICGDPSGGEQKHLQGGVSASGQVASWYSVGQVIDVNVYMSTFHNGRYQLRICVLPTSVTEQDGLNEGCLDSHRLTLVNPGPGQNGGDVWFYPDGSDYQTSQWQLPGDVQCDGISTKCILQWNYLTGNTCTPDGTPAQWVNPVLPLCSNPGAGYPEQFWNCADIIIGGDSATTFVAGYGGAYVAAASADPIPSPPTPDAEWTAPAPPTPLEQEQPASDGSSQPSGDGSQPSSDGSGDGSQPSSDGSGDDAGCFCASSQQGSFADRPNSCVTYFVCDQTGAFSMPCPDGLKFNDALGVCDWPDAVQC